MSANDDSSWDLRMTSDETSALDAFTWVQSVAESMENGRREDAGRLIDDRLDDAAPDEVGYLVGLLFGLWLDTASVAAHDHGRGDEHPSPREAHGRYHRYCDEAVVLGRARLLRGLDRMDDEDGEVGP